MAPFCIWVNDAYGHAEWNVVISDVKFHTLKVKSISVTFCALFTWENFPETGHALLSPYSDESNTFYVLCLFHSSHCPNHIIPYLFLIRFLVPSSPCCTLFSIATTTTRLVCLCVYCSGCRRPLRLNSDE